MARFYGKVVGQRNGNGQHSEATRLGGKSIDTTAASWKGAIRVSLSRGKDDDTAPHAIVEMITWHGAGCYAVLFDGPVNQPPVGWINPAKLDAAALAGYYVQPKFIDGGCTVVWRLVKPSGGLHTEDFATPSAAWRAAVMCL